MYRAKGCEHDQLQEITKRGQVRQVRPHRQSHTAQRLAMHKVSVTTVTTVPFPLLRAESLYLDHAKMVAILHLL